MSAEKYFNKIGNYFGFSKITQDFIFPENGFEDGIAFNSQLPPP